MVNNDLQGLVETRPLKAWKETLALLCTVMTPPLAFLQLEAVNCIMEH